ncbi:MAG: hypothetical protein Q9217_002443 [Psora testacea]
MSRQSFNTITHWRLLVPPCWFFSKVIKEIPQSFLSSTPSLRSLTSTAGSRFTLGGAVSYGPSFWTIISSSSEQAIVSEGLPSSFDITRLLAGTNRHQALRPPRHESINKSIAPGRIPLVLIILTPAHIGLLSQSHAFIRETLRTSFGKIEFGQEIHALVAIIDRVPIPTSSDLHSEDLVDYHTITAHQNHNGYQGISVGTFDSYIAAPDLWSHRNVSSKWDNMDIQQPSTLSFSITGVNQVSRLLQVPIANTIFQNGMPATLFAQRWIMEGKAGDLICIEEAHLRRQTIHMTRRPDIADNQLDFNLHTKLRPITPARTVTAAIGNVISKVEVDKDQERPASQELESTINDQIRNGKLERDKVEVWALLRPQNNSSPDPSSSNLIDLQAAIASGARLLKVLSGGGGWGEKQGLLAVDPDSGYDSRASHIYTEDKDAAIERGGIFADIVKPGDTITFLVNDVAFAMRSIKAVESERQLPRTRKFALRKQLLDFGCLPSTMDAMPTPKNGENSSTRPSPHMLIKKYFGILSERGMSLKSTFASECKSLPDIQACGSAPKPPVMTKLDAPYTVVSIRQKLSQVVPEISIARDDANQPSMERGSPGTHASPIGSDPTSKALEATNRMGDYTAQKSSKTANKITRVKLVLEKKNGGEHEHTSGDTTESPQPTIRKFITRADGLATKEAIERSKERESDMDETTAQRYHTKVFHGASTAQALAYAVQSVESRESTNPTPVRWLQQGPVQQAEYVPTRPMGDGLVRSYGVSENNPRDRARKGFRIAKHASISEKGKAMERQERSPITSRDQAKNLHYQYLSALDSQKKPFGEHINIKLLHDTQNDAQALHEAVDSYSQHPSPSIPSSKSPHRQSVRPGPKVHPPIYFTVDDELLYNRFHADFGPLHIGHLYRFAVYLHEILGDQNNAERGIVFWSKPDSRSRANAACLLACYMILLQGWAPHLALAPIAQAEPSFMPFRDAGYSQADFSISIQDVVYGLWRAREQNLVSLGHGFRLDEYERYERVDQGDFNWLTPSFIALASPQHKPTDIIPSTSPLYETLPTTPHDVKKSCLPAPFKNVLCHFSKRNVGLVVRLNSKLYSPSYFTALGINHLDMIFDDGTCPPLHMVKKFIRIAHEMITVRNKAIAVHCKAGLGRTGCLIGAYMIYRYDFTANEIIAFMRFMRPGMVVGPQQHWLHINQGYFREWWWEDLMKEKFAAALPSTPTKSIRRSHVSVGQTATPPDASQSGKRSALGEITHNETAVNPSTMDENLPAPTPGQPRKTSRVDARHHPYARATSGAFTAAAGKAEELENQVVEMHTHGQKPGPDRGENGEEWELRVLGRRTSSHSPRSSEKKRAVSYTTTTTSTRYSTTGEDEALQELTSDVENWTHYDQPFDKASRPKSPTCSKNRSGSGTLGVAKMRGSPVRRSAESREVKSGGVRKTSGRVGSMGGSLRARS